jgi:CBS domain containing-hemolysin-like protein
MINIPDLANQYGIELPSDDGYETLAGFLLFELGDLPQVGTQVKHEKLRFTVMEMERNRIARVQVERLGADG